MTDKNKEPAAQAAEPAGNIAQVIIGCDECPSNTGLAVGNLAEVQERMKEVGQTVECARCKTKWLLTELWPSGKITTEGEQWMLQPIFTPVNALPKNVRLSKMVILED